MSRMKFCLLALAGTIFLGTMCVDANAQGQVEKQKLPPLKKTGPLIVAVDLAIMDLFYDEGANTVYVQVGNVGKGNSGRFVVRLSLKSPGASKKTYMEKALDGLKGNTDDSVTFRLSQPGKDLEIGVFVDAKKEIKETDEQNCGKLFPGGGTAGSLACDGF